MKLTLFFLVLFSLQLVFCQTEERNGIYKYTDQHITIKWFPKDYDELREILRKPVKIYRIELDKQTTISSEDIGDDHLLIERERVQISLEDKMQVEEYQLKQGMIIEPFLNNKAMNDEQDKNFSFALAMVEVLVSEDFQVDIGITYSEPVAANKRYVYKVQYPGLAPWLIEVNTASNTNYPIVNHDLSLDKKETVDINWSSSLYEKEYFGFQIEKSVKDSTSGEFLLKTPFLPFKNQYEKPDKLEQIRDDSLVKGANHYYRIRGIDLFGSPQKWSNWKVIYVPNTIEAFIEIDTIWATSTSREVRAVITPIKKKVGADAAILMRSKERGEGFEVIGSQSIDSNKVAWSIPFTKTGEAYYYKTLLTNSDLDSVSSAPRYFFTFDADPPSPPQGLLGEIDSSGVVQLNWTAPQGDDILGYRVFRGNALFEEFVERTEVLADLTAFTDTLLLNNLTSQIYYYIRAVDKNYNNSTPSDTLLIIKPDTIAPIPCLLKSINVVSEGLNITWIVSPSEDVKTNYLLRFSANKVDTLLTFDNTHETIWLDSSLVFGNEYSYQISTLDESNNIVHSQKQYQKYEPGFRNPLPGLSADVDRLNKHILLSWKPIREEIFSIQIYRAKGEDSNPSLYKTLKTVNSNEFKDTNLTINNSYTYSVKYITKRGIHSKPVTVEVQY